MSNTLLTPTAVTREALRVLHQKLNFVGSIDRQYDDSFAQTGAKIGTTLKIRKPNRYVVRTGATLNVQDTEEASETLTVATQKGVDMKFTSVDLTMSLDDFSKRIINPAMSVLAASIESDAISMYKDVYNEISDVGASVTSTDLLNVRKRMVDDLTPAGAWKICLDTQANVDLVDGLKALFNDQKALGQQYRDGYMGHALGYDFMENTLMPIHTTGTDDGTADYATDIAAGEADGSAGLLHIDTGAGTFKKGDIIYVQNVLRVHPETKASTGVMQPFVVTSDFSGGEGDLAISPNIVSSGGSQNVNAAAADGALIYKVESDRTTAIGASADYNISLAFHPEAFAFATADLIMPKGVDFTSRQVMDGISMRIVRDYDINNDAMPCRIDVLYGYKTVRPELACRLGFN